ncbi:GHKL domain-containing protein [Dyadobacter sp. SG02]|uniref:sensor histidine kinase n=1 Tax=Dyadobacter sp. SG02 TaxID=1855291 RepID=UPI0008CD6DFD|nr:histidine kinase [Dyadobacter sp. SG02]SEI39199.1 GHKL domain-containing protein [Dyadobacter sp. SG02]
MTRAIVFLMSSMHICNADKALTNKPMSSIFSSDNKEATQTGIYAVLTMAACVPLYFGIDTYLNTIGAAHDEALAVAATSVLLGCIYIGRHLATIWSARQREIPKNVLNGLAIAIAVCFVWLFIHADLELHDFPGLNLLLYWVPFLTIGLSIGALIKLFRMSTKKELEAAKTQAAQSQSELHLLQSQLSPHFLFNTLNNMYGLSITQHEKIPSLILKLSDLLRYSVYEANETYVPLKDELAYIHNYIDFEQLRIGDRLELKTDIETLSSNDIRIAPMLLIVFIENAFKHSKNTSEPKVFIEIRLKIWGNSILFYLKNSHNRSIANEQTVEKHSGFGLANVKKRLQLLYPNQHDLAIENEENHYTVNLRLNLR